MSSRRSQKTTSPFSHSKSSSSQKNSSHQLLDSIFLQCPVCGTNIIKANIESHVENCLAAQQTQQESKPICSTNEVEDGMNTTPTPSPIKNEISSSMSATSPTRKRTHLSQPDEVFITPLKQIPKQARNERKPLAERMRPTRFNDLSGNSDLFKEGSVTRSLIEHDPPPSLILFGPPGCGKTTVASVIKNITHCPFRSLSCCTAGIADITEIAEQADKDYHIRGLPTILFMDEIHRFNKRQQDIFLTFVERGTLILLGATTENPSFSINSALLSRCRVLPLKMLSTEDISSIIRRAMSEDQYIIQSGGIIHEDMIQAIAKKADGDARVALNIVDACCSYVYQQSDKNVTEDIINQSFNQRLVRYDKNGEEHYSMASALQKSRGSDVQGSLYWLARMLEEGEDPLFISVLHIICRFIARRLIVMASEEVGLADPNALTLASSCYQACKDIGVPECNLTLAECAAYLALTSKSNEVAMAYSRLKQTVHEGINPPVPLHIRNAPIESMEDLGYGIGYQYGYNKNQTYLPEEYKNHVFMDVNRAVADLRSVSMDKYLQSGTTNNDESVTKKTREMTVPKF